MSFLLYLNLFHFYHLCGYCSCISAFTLQFAFFFLSVCILLYLIFLPLYFLNFVGSISLQIYSSCLPPLYLLIFFQLSLTFAGFSPSAFPFQAHTASLVPRAAEGHRTQTPLAWGPRDLAATRCFGENISYNLVISLP